MIKINNDTNMYKVTKYLLGHSHLMEDFSTMTALRNHLRKELDMPKLDDATVAPIVYALLIK